MNDRDNRQAFRTEPRIEPVIDAGGAGHTPAPAADYPEAGGMPAWLKETEPEASLLERYGRPVLMWGGALLAVSAVAAGALWLRTEQKAHSELDAIAMSSRAADAAVIAAAPPAPVVPERRDVKVPPMVTLTPDGSTVMSAPAQGAVPATAQAVPAPPPAPLVAEAAPPAAALVKPAPRNTRAKPLVAKAPVKAATKARRTLTAAPWPPAPSRKLPLAQNVLPKVKMKPGARAKVANVTKVAPARSKRLAAAKPKAQPRKVAAITLPPSKPRPVLLPPAREYPRDPVPIPRSCAKGELARDCAN